VNTPLTVRWTIGDVAPRGFEALALSVQGATRAFGDAAEYVVCVNTLEVAEAQRRTGPVPPRVQWRPVSIEDIPTEIQRAFGRALAEGAAWKLAPPRVSPDALELALDNDCILWDLPETLRHWISDAKAGGTRSIFATDSTRAYGSFDAWCPPPAHPPLNAGLRGVPAALDYEEALAATLSRLPKDARLVSELDEQGLQVAAAMFGGMPLAVPAPDLTMCSPFHPHTPRPGRCGAHLVGLNARHIPWNYYDRPADEVMAEHWERLRPELRARVAEGSTTTDANHIRSVRP